MFSSILFAAEEQRQAYFELSADCAADLRIEQVLAALEPDAQAACWFRRPLTDADAIRFRQDVMRDLEQDAPRRALGSFADRILKLRDERDVLLREEDRSLLGCSRWLCLADAYCAALESLAALPRQTLCSAGLVRFFRELDSYHSGERYTRLHRRLEEQMARFSALRFCMLIREGKLRIRPFEEEPSVEDELKALFARFDAPLPPDPPMERPAVRRARHIDAAVLDLLAHWYPEEFELLRRFAAEEQDFLEPELVQFAGELSFYLSWRQLIGPLRQAGLPFCFPELTEQGQPLSCTDGFDLALARELQKEGRAMVTNSFELREGEQILVVTGPNQGGKTTFARFVGQSFYWAALGCCIPGSRAVLRCMDGLYTHFSREEELAAGSGKLQDDLLRLYDILQRATRQSVIIINEIYASTTLQDAEELGRRMMQELTGLGCTAVCVTFLDELARFGPGTVSMMSTVEEDDPAKRKFKIVRRQADGLAYALGLARSHGLDYETLSRRLPQ